MNKNIMRKHYDKLCKEQLIDLLIKTREENELLQSESKKYRLILDLKRKIKRALAYINFYTSNGEYMTDNDKELLQILLNGRTGMWYETYKTQQKENKRKN